MMWKSGRSARRAGKTQMRPSAGACSRIGLLAAAAALALCGAAAAQLGYDTHEIDVGEADSYQLLFGNLTGAETEDFVFFAEAGGVRRMAVYSHDGGSFSRVHLAEGCCRSFGWVGMIHLGGDGWVGEAEMLEAGAQWPEDTVPLHVLLSEAREARESGSVPDPSSRLLLGIKDFNADGIGDIVSRPMGVAKLRWDFHFGRRKGKATHFREAPDTSILLDGGLQLPLQLYDLDGDGREEVCMVPSPPTLSGILSAVFTRSARLELHCYQMTEGGYPPAPSRRWRFRVPANVPTPSTFGDLTGDGLLDAVVPASGTRLHVYPGTGDARLFKDEPIAVDVDLPRTDESLRFRDLNGDGTADMYVNRGGAEGSPLRTWVALSR